jgi:hypothetical protein
MQEAYKFILKSPVGIATGCGLEGRVRFPTGARDTSLLHSAETLGPTQPPLQWVSRALSPGREADLSRQPSAKIKNGEATPQLPHTYSWHVA